MSSQTEGRVLLALQAYQNHNMPSLRAAAKAYDINFTTLQRRHQGVPPRADTPANSAKLTPSEEEFLSRRFSISLPKDSLLSMLLSKIWPISCYKARNHLLLKQLEEIGSQHL